MKPGDKFPIVWHGRLLRAVVVRIKDGVVHWTEFRPKDGVQGS